MVRVERRLLIEITSDNRNRTVAEIRSVLTKNHGNMAEAGAVSWQFHKKGLLTIDKSKSDEDTLLSLALDAGAEDVKVGEKSFRSHHQPARLRRGQESPGRCEDRVRPWQRSPIIPQNTIKLEEKGAEQMLKLMEDPGRA